MGWSYYLVNTVIEGSPCWGAAHGAFPDIQIFPGTYADLMGHSERSGVFMGRQLSDFDSMSQKKSWLCTNSCYMDF
jgi:hypothetical protein